MDVDAYCPKHGPFFIMKLRQVWTNGVGCYYLLFADLNQAAFCHPQTLQVFSLYRSGGCNKMETNLQILPKIVMYFEHSFQCETVIN